MTSAARMNDRTRGGFTLLELVIVLAIAAMVMAGAVSLMVYHSSERILRRASVDIEVLAKQARTISLLQQKPYAVQFTPGKVLLRPLAEVTGVVATQSTQEPEETSGNPEVNAPVHKEIELSPEMALSVRRWASDDWLQPDEKRSQVWRFDPNGLCEPISVRLQYEGSSIENDYHPLTAAIRETFMEIK